MLVELFAQKLVGDFTVGHLIVIWLFLLTGVDTYLYQNYATKTEIMAVQTQIALLRTDISGVKVEVAGVQAQLEYNHLDSQRASTEKELFELKEYVRTHPAHDVLYDRRIDDLTTVKEDLDRDIAENGHGRR